MHLLVRSHDEADQLMERFRISAEHARSWIAAHPGDPLDLLRRIKFEPIGRHPVENRPLNFIEQVNQTWTFAVAVAAAKQLLSAHPDVGGYRLAPGANASLELDIMSIEPGLVGAETFAAVRPQNNKKLRDDIAKLSNRPEQHKYVFFMCPQFPKNERHPRLERDGVQVWSVDV